MKPLVASIALTASLLGSTLQAADVVTIDVYRDPSCGCCEAWIEHLQGNGFSVTDHLEKNMTEVKRQLGVPQELASCHTGVVEGRFIEGHVPAADILNMRKQPSIIGLAVPGMPAGSPGMEMGDRTDAYQVISVDQENTTSVFNSYP
ncbi:DUF411 domain-containing protein [Halopseudomonas pelagia]|uniref:DUF411 domain-containing protein n=1 Tax=Halopseudomonas pelagia TaxID=553151 RepID=UPI0003A3A865|nr:DUF411 domain-containing protein [Halopseudomonas pelagia]